ncbi:MAG: hypothetical protein JNM77_08775 [Pseudonocardia sp.]|nr:hypothetical protein [Pseudonocardia sp.]
MNLNDVRLELAEAVGAIEGVNVHSFYADRVTAPAVVVGWPDPHDYDLTMGRGSDSATFPVLVLVSKNDAESAAAELGAYCNGSGDRSVKAVIEAHDPAGVYDEAVVQSVEFSVVTVAGTEYLGAEFAVAITGTGA